MAEDRGTGDVVTRARCVMCSYRSFQAGIDAARDFLLKDQMSNVEKTLLNIIAARTDADPAEGLERMRMSIIQDLRKFVPGSSTPGEDCCREASLPKKPRKKCKNYGLPDVER